jgi:truncated hemoglobin YjbI
MTQRSPLSRQRLQELIRSLGGEEAFKDLMRRFYRVMADDVMIGFFFAGRDPDTIADKQSLFVLHSAGLIQAPPEHGPATAHRNLAPILKGHFDRRIRILNEVLQNAGVSAGDIKTWVGFEESFRKVVESDS